MILVDALALDFVPVTLDFVSLPLRLAILLVLFVPDFALIATLLVALFALSFFSLILGACRQGRTDAEEDRCDAYRGLHDLLL
jgi:hypothetical protein